MIEKKNGNMNDKNSLVLTFVNEFRDALVMTQRLLALLIEEAEWTDVIGTTMIGKKEIEHQHTYPFQTVLREATLIVKSFRKKWIGDNL